MHLAHLISPLLQVQFLIHFIEQDSLHLDTPAGAKLHTR